MDAAALNQKQYLDVTFSSQDGTAINKATIIDSTPFKLSGTGLDRIQLMSDGTPILRGSQPLLISGFEDTAQSVTYRYFLTPIESATPAPSRGSRTRHRRHRSSRVVKCRSPSPMIALQARHTAQEV